MQAPTLPDILADDLAVVFCGLNPGLKAAHKGHHFDGNGNRFWRTLHLAGYTPRQLRPEEDRELLAYRCGLTAAVARATVGAAELSKHEFKEAAGILRDKIERYRPACIAFLGKAAYAAISGQRELAWGDQAATFGGAKVWILPNPSGLNRAFNQDGLVQAYGELRRALM